MNISKEDNNLVLNFKTEDEYEVFKKSCNIYKNKLIKQDKNISDIQCFIENMEFNKDYECLSEYAITVVYSIEQYPNVLQLLHECVHTYAELTINYDDVCDKMIDIAEKCDSAEETMEQTAIFNTLMCEFIRENELEEEYELWYESKLTNRIRNIIEF